MATDFDRVNFFKITFLAQYIALKAGCSLGVFYTEMVIYRWGRNGINDYSSTIILKDK